MTDRHVLPPYSLRMPADLREGLELAAKQSKRSLNAEIIARLESTFAPVESAVERAARLDQIRDQAMPGIVEIMADLQTKVAEQVEKRAMELMSLRMEQRNLEIEARKIKQRSKPTD